jgi:hypothetical protein
MADIEVRSTAMDTGFEQVRNMALVSEDKQRRLIRLLLRSKDL